MSRDYSKYLFDDSISLLEALKGLNETGKRIIFLVNNGTLTGALTYGDVSRWILKGKELNASARDAATGNPICVLEKERHLADAIFDKKNINAIPIVNNQNMIVDILFKEREKKKYGKIDLPVVIMAGGKGTRLYPYTKILPKPLIPIGDIPISEHIINRFVMNGCHRFYFIVNYKKNMIKAYYNEIERTYDVNYIDEDKPLGTGGGLSLMKGMLTSTFILTNCDSFIDEDYSQIVKEHKEKKNTITMICSNCNYEVPYGVIDIESNGSLTAIREKPRLSYLVNTGSYIVEPEVVDMIEPNKAIGFPDIVDMVKKSGKRVGVYVVDEKSWLDMGQFGAMDKMKKRLGIIE